MIDLNIPYVSLHNHTHFSMMHALSSPLELFQRAKKQGQNAIAVTDLGTLSGMWDSLKASKETGVKLIAGCEFYFTNDVNKTEDSRLRHLVLIAKNHQGYKNLLLLNKKGYDNFVELFKKAIPRIDWKLLEEHREGLICLSGCGQGIISQLLMQKKFDDAIKQTKKLKEIFHDDFALELQPHNLKRKASPASGEIDQRFINNQLKNIADKTGVKCVAATDSHYTNKEEHDVHDTLLAISSGQPKKSGNRITYNVPDFYIKNSLEVASYFVRLRKLWGEEFIRQLFENTVEFANKCEYPDWIDPKYSNPSGKELPEFPVKDEPDYKEFLSWLKNSEYKDLKEDDAFLRYKVEKAFEDFKPPEGKEQEYRDRLEEELDTFKYCGISGYMLIVADYINWAKKNSILVGPGRGSSGSSLVGFLLDIHIADPIKYGLLFERFYNKLKIGSFSDIDSDFCSSKHYMIEEYLVKKYGRRNVAHISNLNRITPKVYARDVSRALELGGSTKEAVKIGNELADCIPNDAKNFDSLFDDAPLLAEHLKEYPELKTYSKIGGQYRNWSTHAAGVVVGKRKLDEIVPVKKDINGSISLEYDMERAEDNGLVKVDLLGLTIFDIIDTTKNIIKSRGKEVPEIDPNIYDEKTFDLISSGKTLGVSQFGTNTGTMALCKKMKPRSLEDLALLTTLVRPASKEIREDFFKTRRGEKEIEVFHPKLYNSLKKTFGFALFDETLLELTNDIAGWDLAEADRLRKLTKDKGKHPEKAEQCKKDFIKDAINNGIDEKNAKRIWTDVIEPFQKYSFNKSHAILYSMTSFVTAYLKAHFPLEFLVANLIFKTNSNAVDAEDMVVAFKDEIRSMGVEFVAPDINKSDTTYKIIDDNTVMTGLDSLKYMGKDSIPEILEKRPFNSFEDFISRVDAKKVRSPTIQALAASGCLDSFGISRRLMFYYAADYRKKLQVHLKKKNVGEFNYPWAEEPPWTTKELYALEEYYLGEGITGTVKTRFPGFFDNAIGFSELPDIFPYKDLDSNPKRNRKRNTHNLSDMDNFSGIRGIITKIWSFKVKKEDSPIRGQEMARITIQDIYGDKIDLVAFPDKWIYIKRRIPGLLGSKNKISEGIAIACDGQFQYDDQYNYSIVVDDIMDAKPAPQAPRDLKGKKVKLPRATKKKKLSELDENGFREEFENNLIDQGLNLDD